jgi:hypothetical protein
MQSTIAFEWLNRIRQKTIKNITHTEFITKYAGHMQNINNLVLILCGLRYSQKEYFIIKIHGAIYEPFAGPHLVQIGNKPPFWVHSLTAFRREFFGLTDKLSFERSVFVCLSDGEVVRLKIARPYLFMHHNVAVADGEKLKIMKNTQEHFYITNRDINKHKEEMRIKKEEARATQQAVRLRIRNHLINSVQHLFCSYLRDHHISPDIAEQWFRVDLNYAVEQCTLLYSRMNRVVSSHENVELGIPRTTLVANASECEGAVSILQESSSAIDISANLPRLDTSLGYTPQPMEVDMINSAISGLLPDNSLLINEGVFIDLESNRENEEDIAL